MSTGCQKDRNIERQTDRQTDRLTDRQTDRQKTERLFSLFIKTKVVKKVNRMSERQKDRPTDRQIERQKDFSAQLSEQKLLGMSTGCKKDRKTGQQTD